MQEVPTAQLLQRLPHRKRINQLNSFASARGVRLYLVGGCVRDLLLNRPVSDLDFAMEQDALSFARDFADVLGGAFVALEEKLPTARIVIRASGFTLDFAQFRGGSIEDDLRLRDLTINAIGIELSSLTTQTFVRLIDPCNGLADLKSSRLRFPSESVVLEDPLRLLRVYRFAAQLDFAISEQTTRLIRRHKNLLSQAKSREMSRDMVAAERVRDELIKILDAANAAAHIRQMDDIGVLAQILPEIESMRGIQRDASDCLDLWERSLLALQRFEEEPLPKALAPYQSEIQDYLNTSLVYGLRRESIIKLALILRNLEKPATKTDDSRGIAQPIEHGTVGAEITVRIVKRLRLGSKAAKLMSCLVRHHRRFMELLETNPTHRSISRFLKSVNQDWLGVLLVCYADLRALPEDRREPPDLSKAEGLMEEIADRYFLDILPMMARGRLISGDEIMDALDLQSGVIIGKILKHVEELQFDGEIRTREEALEAARRFLETSN